MVAGKSATGGRGPGGSLPHHISAIAHHFLGEGPAGATARTGPVFPVSVMAGPVAGIRIAHHQLKLGQALSRLSPTADVILLEPGAGGQSVRDLPGGGQLVPLSEADEVLPARAFPAAVRGFRLPTPGSGGVPVGPQARFMLQNLAYLADGSLTAWEQLRDRPDLLGGVPAAGACLVWCLDPAALASRAHTLTLGRWVDLIRPAGLEVLVSAPPDQVANESWLARMTSRPPGPTEDDLVRFRQWLVRILPEIPVHMNMPMADRGRGRGGRTAPYAEIAERLAGPPSATLSARS